MAPPDAGKLALVCPRPDQFANLPPHCFEIRGQFNPAYRRDFASTRTAVFDYRRAPRRMIRRLCCNLVTRLFLTAPILCALAMMPQLTRAADQFDDSADMAGMADVPLV